MNLSFEPKGRSLKNPEASIFTQDLFNSKQEGKSVQLQFPIITFQIEFRITTIKFCTRLYKKTALWIPFPLASSLVPKV